MTVTLGMVDSVEVPDPAPPDKPRFDKPGPDKPRKVLRIEREARFEAARGQLLARLTGGRRDDGWFKQPGVVGRNHGRDVEVRFVGGPDARAVHAQTRIRTGDRFRACPRSRLLRWLGASYLKIRGTPPPEGVAYALERLLRDFGATQVLGGDGLVQAYLVWDPAAPDPERILKVLDRLHRIALSLEDIQIPLAESGGDLACPFCRGEIEETAPLARCDACGTPYHPSCFEEGNGCAIYGCRNRIARTSSGRFRQVEGPAPRGKAVGDDAA